MAWFTEGEKNAPGANTLLATTVSTIVPATVMVTATVATTVVLEHRNHTNTGTKMAIKINVPASGTYWFPVKTISFDVVDEFVRIVTDGAMLLGKVQAVIFCEVP
jgi:hypothetical protein